MALHSRSLAGTICSAVALALAACSGGGGGEAAPACDPPCLAARCGAEGEGYVAHLADRCEAGGCVEAAGAPCGLFTCAGGGGAGDTCATACLDDTQCVTSAHCEGGVCVADLANGAACDASPQCAGGHCQNGFCCDAGDCCDVAEDCPTYGTSVPICEDASTCRGSRGEPACVAFSCTAPAGVPDDSACGGTTLAKECGFYPAVYCSGAVEQAAPECPTSCATHADCDANGFCDAGTCKGDLADGQPCGGEAERCASGHCQNGFCCASGDCCSAAADCPASYSAPAVCSSVATCQGARATATCVSSACGTAAVADDSGCTPEAEASDCGLYPAVHCSGAADQAAPACATSCASDAGCDPSAHCAAGTCQPDVADGEACTSSSQCTGGRCANGYCCGAGDCCASGADCGAWATAPACLDAATCQGQRVDGVCGAEHACTSAPVADDSGCAGLESDACGLYAPVVCTAAPAQPTDQGALCAASCAGDADCDASAHCEAGTCVADLGLGGACDGAGDCDTGFCVDGVCCASECNGTCESCGLPGGLGLCLPVPDGQDPAAECGALSCSGYYFGWMGDTCYARASVTAAGATCGGDRACRSAAEECPTQPAGGAARTCDAVCQDPTAGTCSGTTAGTCTNVNPGTQSCGSGRCRVTVPLCASGAPNPCVPNMSAAVAELCNGVDDDCDGIVDDGFNLATDPGNCGSCGFVCSNDHGSVGCSGGVCTPTCASGWASCDGNAANGCEALLDDAPACASAGNLGTISGDTGSGYLAVSGTSAERFYLRVAEDDGSWLSSVYLSASIELLNPPNVDFDLYVTCLSCTGALAGSSLLGAGGTDVVTYRKDDNVFVDDSALVYVEVRYFSAGVCAPWTLQIRGNVAASAANCN